jgi:hypothetical protein
MTDASGAADTSAEIAASDAVEAPTAPESATPMPDETSAARCMNCGTTLIGAFCHRCGQRQDDLHRSMLRLSGEVVSSFVNVDGQVLRTLPRLLFRPWDLTRDYLAGERMSQTPPLRLFLIVVVLVFVAGVFGDRSGGGPSFHVVDSPEQAARIEARQPRSSRPPVFINPSRPTNAFERWLFPAVARAVSSQQAFGQAMFDWAQRLTVLLLPVGALTLGLLFVFDRRYVLFDHLIFTMHSLAAQGLLLSFVLAVGRFAPAVAWLLWLSPVHLFAHLKGAYRIGVLGTLVRMTGLFVGAVVGVGLLLFALFLISVYEVGGR